MVAKLSPPAQCSLEIVRNVIEERSQQKDFFEALSGDWITMIGEYQNQSGNPRVIIPLDLSQYISDERIQYESTKAPKQGESADTEERLYGRRKNSLLNLYNAKEGTDLHAILDGMRRNHGLKFCPSCGEPGKPGTLDHYLPKTEYPELAIVLVNLTPMCEACQEKKRTSALDDEGNKLFIHPYFDPIDDADLSLTISEPYDCPTSFGVEVSLNVDEPLRLLVERHLSGIQFRERFEEFCIDEYSDLISVFSEERADDDPDRAERIIRRFLTKNDRQSHNRWEAIFYRGVLANINLLDYLDNGDLPDSF